MDKDFITMQSGHTGWAPRLRLAKEELTVVAYTKHYFGDQYVKSFTLPGEWGCNLTCNFSSDLSLAMQADALWFHAPSLTALPKFKRNGQVWVLMSMESDCNYPFLKDPKFLSYFDLLMTYHLDADIPALYLSKKHYGDLLKPPLSTAEKSQNEALAAYIISNPVSHRDAYARELMKYLPIDAPGKCLHNKTIPGFITGANAFSRGGFQSVMDIIPRYKFYLAFENSITKDYITERLFHALAAGVVPIYYGAPNIKEFLPADNAAIIAADFSGPQELAEYCLYLDRNDEAYESHLAWKTQGWSESFQRLLDIGDTEPLYRMAVKLAHGCGRDCPCGGRIRI